MKSPEFLVTGRFRAGMFDLGKEKLDQLDLNSIRSDFIAKNQSRKAFFGHE